MSQLGLLTFIFLKLGAQRTVVLQAAGSGIWVSIRKKRYREIKCMPPRALRTSRTIKSLSF